MRGVICLWAGRKRVIGKIFTVRFIDSAGQIHLEKTGLALIPGVDEYEIAK